MEEGMEGAGEKGGEGEHGHTFTRSNGDALAPSTLSAKASITGARSKRILSILFNFTLPAQHVAGSNKWRIKACNRLKLHPGKYPSTGRKVLTLYPDTNAWISLSHN
jgi:hypothetical protein